jgi:hypothetical protein
MKTSHYFGPTVLEKIYSRVNYHLETSIKKQKNALQELNQIIENLSVEDRIVREILVTSFIGENARPRKHKYWISFLKNFHSWSEKIFNNAIHFQRNIDNQWIDSRLTYYSFIKSYLCFLGNKFYQCPVITSVFTLIGLPILPIQMIWNEFKYQYRPYNQLKEIKTNNNQYEILHEGLCQLSHVELQKLCDPVTYIPKYKKNKSKKNKSKKNKSKKNSVLTNFLINTRGQQKLEIYEYSYLLSAYEHYRSLSPSGSRYAGVFFGGTAEPPPPEEWLKCKKRDLIEALKRQEKEDELFNMN